MRINKIDAINSRIKVQRKNPRFKRCSIQLEYPSLASSLLKQSSLLAKLLTHTFYTENKYIFPLNLLVEGTVK